MFYFPHRRRNPLTGDWVLVSPQRATRPWLGQVEKPAPELLPAYDPDCYLCPGNRRADGVRNPVYAGPFVFDNDFPALQAGSPADNGSMEATSGLFSAHPESGVCRVVCFSPRHDLTLPELAGPELEAVIRAWAEQTAELLPRPGIAHVQVFENKGAMMGCSNPHPHSQIWAQSRLPNEAARELAAQQVFFRHNPEPLLLTCLEEELRRGERIVYVNEHFAALVPFWAVWPFEILVIARRPVPDLPSLSGPEIAALADVFRRVTAKYDNLFEISFPYSMGFHQAPNDGELHPEWTLHAHFFPPLLRSAVVRKFMVGYEMLAMPQRDITPETAAERLRSTPEVHYRNRLAPEGKP